MTTIQTITKAVRAHANKTHTGGWDFVVRHWTDADIASEVKGAGITSIDGAIAHFGGICARVSGGRLHVSMD